MTKQLADLDEREDTSPEEKELAELLTVLVDEYEERRYPIRKASPTDTKAFDGSPQTYPEGPLEGFRFKRHYLRGVSRQARHQQSPGKKTGRVFSCEYRTVHLGSVRSFESGHPSKLQPHRNFPQ